MTKRPNQKMNLIFLACVMGLPYTGSLPSAALAGAVIFLGATVTGLFFSGTKNWFPRRVLGFAFILWLTALAHLGWFLFSAAPIWILSVAVLLSDCLNESEPKPAGQIFNKSGWFLLIFSGIALSTDYFSQSVRMHIFQTPAGGLLMLAVFYFLYRKIVPEAGRG